MSTTGIDLKEIKEQNTQTIEHLIKACENSNVLLHRYRNTLYPGEAATEIKNQIEANRAAISEGNEAKGKVDITKAFELLDRAKQIAYWSGDHELTDMLIEAQNIFENGKHV